jgi:transcription elongation factor Elf1
MGELNTYRYECPICESTQIFKRTNGLTTHNRNVPKHKEKYQYRCKSCKERIPHLWDKKNETNARP